MCYSCRNFRYCLSNNMTSKEYCDSPSNKCTSCHFWNWLGNNFVMLSVSVFLIIYSSLEYFSLSPQTLYFSFHLLLLHCLLSFSFHLLSHGKDGKETKQSVKSSPSSSFKLSCSTSFLDHNTQGLGL